LLSACRAAAPAQSVFEKDTYATHVQTLSSDEFEGRSPSSPGEEKTVQYLADQFAAVGLSPGNGGSFFQEVALVEITVDSKVQLQVGREGFSEVFDYGRDMMVWTKQPVETVGLEKSELVFAGYGVVAPEHGWDDYAGLDVRGKTVVLLVNDPGFGSQDPNLFKGNAMTYYGRWTYKFDEAARQGAAGALIVHEEAAAGYPWDVVTGSWSGPQFDLPAEPGAPRLQVEGWLTGAAARKIFSLARRDYEESRKAADQAGFQGFAMGVNASVMLKNKFRESTSRNVVGVLAGSKRPDEYIIYTAHWDHLGTDPDRVEDPIFNGAVDNATGTAALIEIARAFTSLPEAPERTIVFMAVTAEESGLLGSRHYAENPIFPLAKTVAAINMDGLNVHGRTRDVVVVGRGSSELERYLEEAAREQGRYTTAEKHPEKGTFYRSDHFNFAKKGVPVLYAKGGEDSVKHGSEWGKLQSEEYTRERYHKPSDEFDPSWDFGGALEDMQLYFEIGLRLSQEKTFPNWLPGNEFRAARDESRAAFLAKPG
jgi:Zn-dependent M28 family amino/carboxypeptidase